MSLFIDHIYCSLKFSFNVLLFSGLYQSDCRTEFWKVLNFIYFLVVYIFLVGTYIVVQTGEVIQVWGDIPLMTAALFLLFTNCSLSIKMLNFVHKLKKIKLVVRECENELLAEDREYGQQIITRFKRETKLQLLTYILLTGGTILGWGASAEKNQLPLRAWYPYNTMKSPAYELTYIHQCVAVGLAATINISVDTVATSLVALCRCRLLLLSLSLNTLFDGLSLTEKGILHPSDEVVAWSRLRECIRRHQSVLQATGIVQRCFSYPVLAQFIVSMFIICATAYQLAFEEANLIRTASMIFYLIVMTYEVFIYCYQGNQILLESEAVSEAAYGSDWFVSGMRLRRAILLLMSRANRPLTLTAGGFADLSLPTFMAIIKASYTFFTVLQGVGAK